ncbi:MAG: hypothetical protein A2X13_14590 [Bacteroidetes bacterium GWC2_33_15]|nr:MAG: hypothetical protein A2X10_12635 [Bacteroidetes bacterium GWA2_33_15]OFX50100.1 MAG: hypothetical protein A2X13_14590 [Bacteroidetes bacterium GWC2_33_15]OFX65253.1 MAG: hypothetical protein A2X15_04165 [Bacteroidetes bacterium GWB2_32_14]OFX70479.1 MAG: hypothetical protein A2X14_04220 [Bacteroidetes bacterium GWD2_33_33]HAN19648.1 hypothetical protein [Bacteroidales bacterium]
MKQTWDNLFVDLDTFATSMKEFFAIVPRSPAFASEIKKLEKQWRSIQKNVNKFEADFNPAKPIIIQIPDEFNGPDFEEAWQAWKDYLAEQHNIVMLSRMESQSLQLLLELSERNKTEAMYMLKYASATGYPKFFKVNKTTVNNQKLNSDAKTTDPDFGK